ncbi:unnamed protein product, partial [Allacma fusca]
MDIIRKIQIEERNVVMGYRPNIRPSVQQRMNRPETKVINNSLGYESQESEPSTSGTQPVITSTSQGPKPSSSDKLDTSDSKGSNKKGVAYPNRVPQPTIVVSSEEEDIKPEVQSQNIAKVNEKTDTIRKGLDQDLDDYWKNSSTEEDKERPLKKRKFHSSCEVKSHYQLPQEAKGQKELLTATHQRKVYQLPFSRKYIPKLPENELDRAEAIREITVQWYGPYEAFGPMKGLEKIREQFLQQ